MPGTYPKAKGQWRLTLHKGDEAELLKWVEQSGLERVARIIASLTNVSGERGQPEKPDSVLLLKIAHLKQQQPDRKLHAIAVEVASEALPFRRPRISRESLVSKLERDFRRQRHTWTTRARSAPSPSREDISQAASRSQSTNEVRVLTRIIGLLPSALDLYDGLLADAKKMGPDEAKLVKLVGRERAEPLLVDAIKKQAASSFVTDSHGVRKIPRNFFDLIESDLKRFRRERTAAKHRMVGRE
jgi:hypothetical protein